MKTQIDIYAGFLDSGKTSLIRQALEQQLDSGERIVVVLCEAGEEDIREDLYPGGNVIVKRLARDEPLKPKFIEELARQYRPQRIVIELNGMSSLEEMLGVLETKSVARICEVSSVVNVADCRNFDMLMGIMGDRLIEQAANSDLIILNHSSAVSKDKQDSLRKTIKALNRSAELVSIELPEDYSRYLEDGDRTKDGGKLLKKPSDWLFAGFFVIVIAYFLITVFNAMHIDLTDLDLVQLQVLNTIFVSILMQAFPFLLLGILVSSVIQVFISREMVVRYFLKNRLASFLAAILGGLLFPVCDCAIVPVASRLVKKGVPLFAAVTFMLAAPIVNPIVIASTLYAFPGQPTVVLYRVCLGITIAVASGLVFLFFPEEETKLLTGSGGLLCGCSCCRTGTDGSLRGKLTAVFKHAGEEFFDAGRFLVIGALLTSIFQVAVSRDFLESIGGAGISSLVIMMAAAVVLSVCSSSDAFIARSFSNQFSMGSVMGFLVLGPMIDIKNVLLLLGSFNKRFVAKFLFVVCGLAFAVLFLFSSILF